jgi:hypothetical protein
VGLPSLVFDLFAFILLVLGIFHFAQKICLGT